VTRAGATLDGSGIADHSGRLTKSYNSRSVKTRKAKMFQTIEQQTETLRWAVLATHLNGAADSGQYDHIDTTVMLRHVRDGDVFEFLRAELGKDVEYALAKLTDVHRHMLLQHWRTMATGFETYQFHVRRSGLALLVAYLLHLIQNRHVQIPK
jgi:hypothetical protein